MTGFATRNEYVLVLNPDKMAPLAVGVGMQAATPLVVAGQTDPAPSHGLRLLARSGLLLDEETQCVG